MGTSWEYFARYEIKPDEDFSDNIIHYIDGGSFDITYTTSGQLASILEYYGILLPVYDTYEPPISKMLELVDPFEVAAAASKGVELLQSEMNPMFGEAFSAEDTKCLFSGDDINEYNTVEILNESIRSYLERMIKLSNTGHYFVRSND
ncbi:vacuolar protein-sorting protein 36 [Paenibacillus sp. FSL P4-0288]|uniref:vacuolar protein-sorting protein 36 n=1 Tax=Paenibacillus sp. FSL P4-0288 TaxID=2921633 RepID=UPI0030F97034